VNVWVKQLSGMRGGKGLVLFQIFRLNFSWNML